MRLLKIITFILFLTQLSFSEARLNDSSAITTLRSVQDRVFSRKRRFVLGPIGCQLKFTVALSKHLISAFPRGFQFVLEAATYYPCPSTRTELLPKKFRIPTTPKPKPTGTTEPIYVYIPGSAVHFKAKPVIKPAKVQRIGEGSVQLIDKSNYEKYTNPKKWTQWAKYGSPSYTQKYEWTPAKMPTTQYQWKPSHQAKWTKWTTEAPRPWWSTKTNYDEWPRRERWGRDIHQPYERTAISDEEDEEVRPYVPVDYPDLEPFENWRHYHSHRERRQLFEHFEGLSRILGIDMKSCILRAICDAKQLLLPPGYSMIHDILRVVFNFPTISGLNDEYSRAMTADFTIFGEKLRAQCPFSVLDLLLSPRKGL